MEVNKNLTEKAKRDYKVVLRARNGDRKAYEELMKYYKDSLYFMLLKMTNSMLDAEDLTIEAFGKAFKRIDLYEPKYAFSTWLFKIATNNCIDFIRKKRMTTISIDKSYGSLEDGIEMSQTLKSPERDPEDEMIRKQKLEVIRSVVDKLKPHYRTLVEMRYFDELSYEEIATELDLPLGTVKAKLFRARDLLANILTKGKEEL